MPLSTEERLARRRRAKRRKRRVMTAIAVAFFAVLALLVWLVVLGVSALGEKNPAPETEIPTPTAAYPTCDATEVAGTVHMNSILLYDATHDRVLYEQNADQMAYPASTTKLLAALVACRYGDEAATYTVGTEQSLVEWDASCAYLEEGRAYPLAGLLDALLLPSGADAAYCLAANVARYHENNPNLSDDAAVEKFVQYMNDLATERTHLAHDRRQVHHARWHDKNHVSNIACDLLRRGQTADAKWRTSGNERFGDLLGRFNQRHGARIARENAHTGLLEDLAERRRTQNVGEHDERRRPPSRQGARGAGGDLVRHRLITRHDVRQYDRLRHDIRQRHRRSGGGRRIALTRTPAYAEGEAEQGGGERKAQTPKELHAVQTLRSACFRSAIRSPGSSRPIERRMRSGGMPAALSCASDS